MSFRFGTSNACFTKAYGIKEGLTVIKNCGFDCVTLDLSDAIESGVLFDKTKTESYFAELKKFLDEIGLVAYQTQLPPLPYNEQDLSTAASIAKNAVLATAVLGGMYAIIEPIVFEDEENTYRESFAANMQLFSEIRELAKENGVCIAVPNTVGYSDIKRTGMPNAYSSAGKLNALLDGLGDGFVACLDTARAYYAGQYPAHTAELLGERLKVVRLADCDGKGADKLPLTAGQIVWKDVAASLAKVGFTGVINFDTDYLRSGKSVAPYLGNVTVGIGKDLAEMIQENNP